MGAALKHAAHVLAENLERAVQAACIAPEELDRAAALDTGTTRRILNADPYAYPCPRRLSRIAGAAGVTTTDLLTEAP